MQGAILFPMEAYKAEVNALLKRFIAQELSYQEYVSALDSAAARLLYRSESAGKPPRESLDG